MSLQKAIAYHFSDVAILKIALTHTSAANEADYEVEHNERLEYLGDAVLELCVSTELYRRFPDAREGTLTALRSQLVNQHKLAIFARILQLDEFLHLGKGEETQGGREKETILSDAFEALMGAVFLDGGYEAANTVILGLYQDSWKKLNCDQKDKDYKSRLQEFTQQLYKQLPIYALIDSAGPEHAKSFSVQLELPCGAIFDATGTSVRRAEQLAASQALRFLFIQHPVEK